ncbi:Kalirin [Manis pentadactyla]|nr:Kalirin [Manis pentadactyla]
MRESRPGAPCRPARGAPRPAASLAGGVAGSRPPRPWPPPAPPWQSTARGIPAAQVFLLSTHITRTRRKSQPGQQAAAKGRRAGAGWPESGQSPLSGTSLRAPLSPKLPTTQRLDSTRTEPPAAWKCSADWEAHCLDEPTEAVRGRAVVILRPWLLRVGSA